MPEPKTLPPPKPSPSDPWDDMIEALTGLAVAVKEMSAEVRDGLSTLSGRVDGVSRASQDLAREVREFGGSTIRLANRLNTLEMLEHEERLRKNGSQ